MPSRLEGGCSEHTDKRDGWWSCRQLELNDQEASQAKGNIYKTQSKGAVNSNLDGRTHSYLVQY